MSSKKGIMMVKVLKAGFYSTVQDLGRFGYQEFGVPYSGVMDRQSAKMANVLLENDLNAAVLEFTMTGPTLQFLKATHICLSGADMSPLLNNKKVHLNTVIRINAGDILSFGKLHFGFRCYLAVLGGFQTESVMQSQSAYKQITKSVVLSKGDTLSYSKTMESHTRKFAHIKPNRNHFTTQEICVYKGPEFDCLPRNQQENLVKGNFSISKHNNRMAYQLNELCSNSLDAILTSAVMPGTVQLTPSGQLIILMRDAQTTGGYPRVLQLSAEAINVLAQKRTGDRIQIKLIQ